MDVNKDPKERYTNVLNVMTKIYAKIVKISLNVHFLARLIMKWLNFHWISLVLRLTSFTRWNMISIMCTMITFVKEKRFQRLSGGKIF